MTFLEPLGLNFPKWKMRGKINFKLIKNIFLIIRGHFSITIPERCHRL